MYEVYLPALGGLSILGVERGNRTGGFGTPIALSFICSNARGGKVGAGFIFRSTLLRNGEGGTGSIS